ncbi:glycosyltransferase family 2 protein [Roseovarius sp. S4756]|uniref:glycosyltransferase family 2 protein n=1 Tax=Roseovarius maritimus TaxID=3342637 RepID=UPI003727C19C
MADPAVTIVTVAYNSAVVLPRMLDSVPAGTPVVLVDNASRDVSDLRALATGTVRLIENPANEGFGRACNVGAAAARTEFVLFLNPDTALMPGALDALVAAARAYPEASAFNPMILDEDGRPQIKRRSDLVARSQWLAKGTPDGDAVLPVLSGAALMVRKADFDTIGGFDPAIFLFFEDDDLSARLAQTCGPLMLAFRAEVRHVGGASSQPSREGDRIKNSSWGWAQIYAVRKHRGLAACAAPFGKALLRALSPATLLSPARRRKYAARLSGMTRALLGSR